MSEEHRTPPEEPRNPIDSAAVHRALCRISAQLANQSTDHVIAVLLDPRYSERGTLTLSATDTSGTPPTAVANRRVRTFSVGRDRDDAVVVDVRQTAPRPVAGWEDIKATVPPAAIDPDALLAEVDAVHAALVDQHNTDILAALSDPLFSRSAPLELVLRDTRPDWQPSYRLLCLDIVRGHLTVTLQRMVP